MALGRGGSTRAASFSIARSSWYPVRRLPRLLITHSPEILTNKLAGSTPGEGLWASRLCSNPGWGVVRVSIE